MNNTKITYSTSYHVYYTGGSIHSGPLTADTENDLKKKMKAFAEAENRVCDIEIVTFEAIKKITEVKRHKGKFVQFKPIKNPYMTDGTPNPRFYSKLI